MGDNFGHVFLFHGVALLLGFLFPAFFGGFELFQELLFSVAQFSGFLVFLRFLLPGSSRP